MPNFECPTVAQSLSKRTLYIQGKYAEAEPLYARAMDIWERALGPDHPNTAAVLNNRAGLLYRQVRTAVWGR